MSYNRYIEEMMNATTVFLIDIERSKPKLQAIHKEHYSLLYILLRLFDQHQPPLQTQAIHKEHYSLLYILLKII